MNEQKFCTQVSVWLRKNKYPQSMLCEAKVVEGNSFSLKILRKSQVATLNKLQDGVPIVHKISDSSVGSKLVDIIYIYSDSSPLKPYITIFSKSQKRAYLIPYILLRHESRVKSFPLTKFNDYVIW